jgi:hypothetical protein
MQECVSQIRTIKKLHEMFPVILNLYVRQISIDHLKRKFLSQVNVLALTYIQQNVKNKNSLSFYILTFDDLVLFTKRTNCSVTCS